MFKCSIKTMPLMGRSVCEVKTPQGTHTAIANSHKASFDAAMQMARVAFDQWAKDNPVENGPDDCQCVRCVTRRALNKAKEEIGSRHH